MNNFIYGFFYPFRCIKLFFRYPKLIGYSIVPLIINLIIYGTIFFYSFSRITGLSEDFISNNVSDKLILEIIKLFLNVFIFLLVLIFCYFMFVILGGIISAPFNEKISRYIEENVFGEQSGFNLPFFKDAFASIRAELKKLLFYFSIIIPLLLIDFIPMIGSVITLVFGTGFSFYYNALDYMDYPMTRRMKGFRVKLKTVNSQMMLSMGFGGISFILTFLPVINVLLNPILVTAGTSLYYEKKYDKAS